MLIESPPEPSSFAIETKMPAVTKKKELVSVLIPVFNAEETVECCLKSMQVQTWENLEVLIVDDCSTDNSLAAIRQFMHHADDNRFQFFQTNRNVGPYIIKNLLLREYVHGEFTTGQDADDYSEKERIERQVVYLAAHPDAGGVGVWMHERIANPLFLEGKMATRRYELDGDGWYHRFLQYPLWTARAPDNKQFQHFTVCASLLTYTRYLFQLGGYDGGTRFGADSEFLNRLIRLTSVGNVNEYLYVRLLRPNSLTTSPETGMGSEARKAYREKIKKRIAEAGMQYRLHGTLPELSAEFVTPSDVQLKRIV